MARKNTLKTHVAIIGAGPSGLLLSQLLSRHGIDSIILECRSKEAVLGQVRAGLLEQGTVDLLREAGASAGLDKDGLIHEGVIISYNGHRHRIPLTELTGGKVVTVYGQQELTRDLIQVREQEGAALLFEARATSITNPDGEAPSVQFTYQGDEYIVECDFVAGCDGFHGVSRKAIPAEITRIYDKKYPFGWLGIIAKVPPSTDELIYSYHDNGFAMHSMRSTEISRLYLQVDVNDSIENWPDERIWQELHRRLASKDWQLKEGPILEKSITLMRSFVVEPMQYRKLFLVGDAAHIVPPTGAKGLNSAAQDARLLYEAFFAFYKQNDCSLLQNYSSQCLKRVWRTQDFSTFMTQLLHVAPYSDEFEKKLQKSRFDYLVSSSAPALAFAENYVGMEAEKLIDAAATEL